MFSCIPYIGTHALMTVQCIFIPNTTQLDDFLPMIYITPFSLSISVVLISNCLYHKWLDPHLKINNPIKLIFRVLNYAWKHKCPQKRSAFTFLDEEQPSRLDYGKGKFGGPFSEEEVKDVKTALRLVPLLQPLLAVGSTTTWYYHSSYCWSLYCSLSLPSTTHYERGTDISTFKP